MDTKYKIIVVVFVAIAFLYVGHFIINYMSTSKKRETFLEEDDVEHYENPSTDSSTSKAPTATSESQYDQRVLILDDIEKLHIVDKDTKGKLMEYMFTERKPAK